MDDFVLLSDVQYCNQVYKDCWLKSLGYDVTMHVDSQGYDSRSVENMNK